MSVKDKVVWITATAGGIGKATAELFVAEGCTKLAICDIDEGRLFELQAELEKQGAQVLAVQYDTTKTEDLEKVFNAVMEKFGTIDVLVNNAGITGPSKPVTEISVEEWDTTLEANLRSMFFNIKQVAPVMKAKKFGKIVNIASVSGKNPLVNRSPYSASKMGVIGMTRTLAAELGPDNITVNAICPGPVAGPRLDWVRKSLAEAQGIPFEQYMQNSLKNVPLRHDVPPGAVAQAVLFLSDEERSNCITGEDLNVTSGVVMF